MSDVNDNGNNGHDGARSWWRRLVQALSGDPKDRDELVELLRDAHRSGLLDADAQAMIEGVLHVSDMHVRDIMVPRPQMAVIARDDDAARVIETVVESGHSRFPVIGDSSDEVEGIVLAKDLLAWSAREPRPPFDLREHLRPAVFIPESKRLNVLLKEFRARRNHIAIVVDEYGNASGLVTIEDVLEQIVGEIDDEYDTDEDVAILKRSDTRWTVKAVTRIEDFNAHFDAYFPDDEHDTMGDLLAAAFGEPPKRDDGIDLGRFRFKVLRADGQRIHLLQVDILPERAGADAVE